MEEISLVRQVLNEVYDSNLVRVRTSDTLNVDVEGMFDCGKVRKRTVPQHSISSLNKQCVASVMWLKALRSRIKVPTKRNNSPAH